MCQQSPSFGSFETGATSAHHFVTPTRDFRAPIAHKIPDQVIAARGREHHRQDEGKVEGEVRIARGPVRRDRERASPEIGFRVDERPLMRVEDVGVEDVRRIDDQRARHPRHVPDRELSISVVDASDVADVEREIGAAI